MPHDAVVYRLETAAGVAVADHIEVADSMGRRGLGLMFRRHLAPGHGIVIRPCSSIHMFFMRFAIDVAFVDGGGVVVHTCNAIKPWRMSKPYVAKSKAAIEVEAGALARAGVATGATLRLVARTD